MMSLAFLLCLIRQSLLHLLLSLLFCFFNLSRMSGIDSITPSLGFLIDFVLSLANCASLSITFHSKSFTCFSMFLVILDMLGLILCIDFSPLLRRELRDWAIFWLGVRLLDYRWWYRIVVMDLWGSVCGFGDQRQRSCQWRHGFVTDGGHLDVIGLIETKL